MKIIPGNLQHSWIYYLLGSMGLAYLFIPIFEVKFILLGILISIILKLIPKEFTIEKQIPVFFISFIYAISFLIVPYWSTKPHYIAKAVGFTIETGGFILLYILYQNHSERILIKQKEPKFYIIFAFLFLFYVVIQYLPLTNSLPYKGDMGLFVGGTMSLLLFLQKFQYIPWLGACLVCIIFYFRTKKPFYLFLMAGFFTGLGTTAYFTRDSDFGPDWFVRYPILSHYINTLLSIPLVTAIKKNLAYQEGFFRIQPFLCTITFVCIILSKTKLKNLLEKILFGIALLTIPSLLYYSSLTYIESILLVFMALALLSYDSEFHKYIQTGKVAPWIVALFLIASLKETSIVFIVSFLAITTLLVFWKSDRSLLHKIKHTSTFFFLTTTPLCVYLFFRLGSGPRIADFHFQNLFVFENYSILVCSFWDQFGLFFPLACISIVLLTLQKKFVSLSLNLLIILGTIILFLSVGSLIDREGVIVGSGFWGYSRFNLYFLPSILCLVVTSFNELKTLKSKWTIPALIIVISINLYLSPIHYDGTRKPGWGDYVRPTSEFDYPYDDFYHWLSENKKIKKILILGRNFEYGDRFYIHKYYLQVDKLDSLYMDGWQMQTSSSSQRSSVLRIKEFPQIEQYDLLVYHDETFNYQSYRPLFTGYGKGLERALSLKHCLENQKEIKVFSNHYLKLVAYLPDHLTQNCLEKSNKQSL